MKIDRLVFFAAFFFAIITTLLFAGINSMLNQNKPVVHRSPPAEILVKSSFLKTGAIPVLTVMEFKASMPISGDLRLSDIIKKMKAGLFDNITQEKINESDTVVRFEHKGSLKNNNQWNTVLIILKNPKEKECHIIVSLERENSMAGISDAAASARKAFAEFGLIPDYNYSVTGSLNGKVNTAAEKRIAYAVLNEAKAGYTSGFKQNGLISISAYTPVLSSYIKNMNKKVNINMSMRYDSIEKKTYIAVGIPLLAGGY